MLILLAVFAKIFGVSAVTDAQLKAGLITAGRQSWLIGKMELEFLMVAKGMNTSESKAHLSESISLFDSEHSMLRDGNGLDIVAAPSDEIVSALSDVQARWSPFKSFLENNVEDNSPTVLTTLSEMSDVLYWLTQACTLRYVDAVNGAGANFSALQVNTASRQSALVERMSAGTFQLHFGVDPVTTLSRVREARTLFAEAHAGILEGLNFVGLEATVSKCILQQMRLVTFRWDEFREVIDTVLFDESAGDQSLEDVAARIPSMRQEAAAATLAYADPPLSCPSNITRRAWGLAFDVSTRQLMFAQKACRLFLQAAKGVNTLDSRVLYSNSDVSAIADLKMMREGSLAAGVAAPATQQVSDGYGVMWLYWLSLGSVMAQNIGAVSAQDDRLLQTVENQGKTFISYGTGALDQLLTECRLRAADVNCEELKVIGLQRLLVQKSAFEAVLIGLERNVEQNRNELIQTIALFEGSHRDLVHHKPPGLPRTTDICILKEMKHVYDLWTPFKSLLMQVHDGDHSVGTLLSIWGMTWDAGVDPMFAQLSVAMHAYREGTGQCTPPLPASRQELESAIKKIGFLRAWTQKLAKQLLLVEKGIDGAHYMDQANATMDEFATQLAWVISGYTPEALPVPIVQIVADRIFDLAGDFAAFRSLTTVDQYANASLDMLHTSELAMGAYVDAAFDRDPTVPGARSSLASSLLMLLEKMCKEAVLLGLGRGSAAELTSTINEYETSQQTLRAGNTVDDVAHAAQMENVESAWGVFRPKITEIAGTGAASDSALRELVSGADAVEAELLTAIDLYATMSVRIVRLPVDILVPLPMTGRWSPGATLRTATMIARDIINEQQLILPGYEIRLTFLDDRCDQEHAMRTVLEQFASRDDWVGLAGMACSRVCESLAVISSSMWIPAVGMDCSGESLSDTTLFPTFVRLGVKTTLAKDAIIEWARRFAWDHIAIVSGDPATYQEEVATYQGAFGDAGIGSSYASPAETDWPSIVSTMDGLNTGKRRVVMVFGTETLFRKVVCASSEVGSREGMVWISVGIRERSWWTLDDEEVLQHSGSCTGGTISRLLEGALFITGLGTPARRSNQALDCFRGYTSHSLLDHIGRSIADGYTDSTGNTTNATEHPHVELMGAGADALCVQAKAIQHMLIDQDIAQLRSPQRDVYRRTVDFIRDDLEIEGVSGPVTFSGNDKPGRLGLWQIRGSEIVPVGSVDNVTMEIGWLQNATWLPAYPDPEADAFPWIYVIIPVAVSFVCCPMCLALALARFGNIFERMWQIKRSEGNKRQKRQENVAGNDQDPGAAAALAQA